MFAGNQNTGSPPHSTPGAEINQSITIGLKYISKMKYFNCDILDYHCYAHCKIAMVNVHWTIQNHNLSLTVVYAINQLTKYKEV